MTKVVHCKKEPYDVYIGRPSKWGNQFREGVHGTRLEVIWKHKNWLMKHPERIQEIKRELKGKVLG